MRIVAGRNATRIDIRGARPYARSIGVTERQRAAAFDVNPEPDRINS